MEIIEFQQGFGNHSGQPLDNQLQLASIEITGDCMYVQDLDAVGRIWSRFIIDRIFAVYPAGVDFDASKLLAGTSTRPHADAEDFFREVVERLSSSGMIKFKAFDGRSLGGAKLTEAVLDRMDPDGVGRAGRIRENTAAIESADLYSRAIEIVVSERKASTSYVMRRLSIGYAAASGLIERMEHDGIISGANHAGKREILVVNSDIPRIAATRMLAAH